MTAREDLDMMSDVEMVFCQDCFFCESIGKIGDKELFQCTNDASDHNEHIFTDSHYACDPDSFTEIKNNDR
jgi:hypothetical protein